MARRDSYLFRYADIQGNGSGRKNANVALGTVGNAAYTVADDLWTDVAHGLETGDKVRFVAKGAGCTVFDTGVTYYVSKVDADTYYLCSTLANAIAGTTIEDTADSTGTWSVERWDTDHQIIVPDGFEYEIHRTLISVYDTKGMEAEEYGNTGAALNGGISALYLDSAGRELVDFTDGVPITYNAGWGALCYDVQLASFGNTTNELLLVRWTLAKSGQPLTLKEGESFCFRLLWNATEDDYSALLSHYFQVQGVMRRTG